MAKWMLAHEAQLNQLMKRSIVVRIVVRVMLAVAIASAEHDERKRASA